MGTAIVALGLIVIVCMVIKSMVRNKIKGKSISCGGNCKNCTMCK